MNRLIHSCRAAAWLIGLAGTGLLSVGCGCGNDLEKNPPAPVPTDPLTVNCSCDITGSAWGSTQSQTVGPFEFCVPTSFGTHAADYCTSGELKDFMRVAALQLAEAQDDRVCSVEVDFDINCSAVNIVGSPSPVTFTALCEGICPSIECNDTNCTPAQILSNTCDCTTPKACGGFSSSVACTPGFFERQTAGSSSSPLIAGTTPGNGLSAVAAHAGNWSRADSRLDVSVSVDILCAPIIGCATTSDSASAAAQGKFNLYGARCPGGSCSLAIDSQIAVDNFDLEFSLGPISETHSVRNLVVDLRTPRNSVHINPDGSGVIPAGELSITATARHVGGGDDDNFRALDRTNDFDLPVRIDWATNTLTVPSVNIPFADGSGTIKLAGTFQNSFAEAFASADADNDGVPNITDNCPMTPNPTQAHVASPVLVVPPNVSTCGEATLGTPTAEDICFGEPVTITNNAAANSPAGTSVVTWVATDVFGNVTSGTQTIEERPALLALRSLLIRDRAVVNSVSGLAKAINLGAVVATDVGVEATVGNLLSNANVFLRDRSRALGSVISRGTVQRGNNVQVLGQLLQGTSLPVGTFPDLTIPGFTPGTVDVNLEPDTTRSITPGNYRNVSVKSRAVLTLAPGTYKLASFALEPQARVVLSGATTLFVRDLVQLRGDFVPNGAGAKVAILFTGTNTVGVERPYAGRIVAPRASVYLGAGSSLVFSGSVFANDIELRPDARFTCAL